MAGIDDAYARVANDPGLQLHWPAPVRPPELPAALGAITPGMAQALFWIVVVIGVGAILFALIALVRRWTPGKRAHAGQTAGRAVPAVITLPVAGLALADTLASQGQYGAAVHALLLSGVGTIDARFPRIVRPASTSRDIARLPILPAPMRDAFATMAEATERAVFAGRDLLRADWEACRARYATLTDKRA